MKFTIAFIASLLFVSTSAFAKANSFHSESTQQMTARLEVGQKGDAGLIINHAKIKLLNTHVPFQSCQLGEFLVEYIPAGVLSHESGWYLVDIIECYEDYYFAHDNEQFYCPTIYQPVCATPQMGQCQPGDLCLQIMPEQRTFENICAVLRDGADFKHHGECQQASTH